MEKRWKHVFVVFRVQHASFESTQREDWSWNNAVTIKLVIGSEDEARSEVERLNGLNAHKGCSYHWQSAKQYVAGGDLGTGSQEESQ